MHRGSMKYQFLLRDSDVPSTLPTSPWSEKGELLMPNARLRCPGYVESAATERCTCWIKTTGEGELPETHLLKSLRLAFTSSTFPMSTRMPLSRTATLLYVSAASNRCMIATTVACCSLVAMTISICAPVSGSKLRSIVPLVSIISGNDAGRDCMWTSSPACSLIEKYETASSRRVLE